MFWGWGKSGVGIWDLGFGIFGEWMDKLTRECLVSWGGDLLVRLGAMGFAGGERLWMFGGKREWGEIRGRDGYLDVVAYS